MRTQIYKKIQALLLVCLVFFATSATLFAQKNYRVHTAAGETTITGSAIDQVKVEGSVVNFYQGTSVAYTFPLADIIKITFAQAEIPAIALIAPADAATVNTANTLTFTWTPVSDITAYTLVISRNSELIDNEAITLSIEAGNTGSYTLTAADVQFLFGSGFAGTDVPFYWTVIPTGCDGALTEIRQFQADKVVHVLSGTSPNAIDVRDFDLGGHGIGYSQWDPKPDWATGYSDQYRIDRGDAGSPHALIRDGGDITLYNDQWLRYTVQVQEAGTYQVAYQLGTGVAGDIIFEVDGASPVYVPYPAGDWATFVNYEGLITLPVGEHQIKLKQGNGGDIKGMTITKIVTTNSIALIAPANAATINATTATSSTFTWDQISQVTDYTLKVSKNSAFPANAAITLSINAGNTGSYTLTADDVKFLFGSGFAGTDVPVYWTVVPTVANSSISTESRQFIADKVVQELSATTPNVFDIRNYDLGGYNVGHGCLEAYNGWGPQSTYRSDRGDNSTSYVMINTDGTESIQFDQGNWWMYTVNVTVAGNYQVAYKIAGGQAGSVILDVDASAVATVPYTQSGWDSFAEYNAVLTLSAGEHKIKFKIDDSATSYGHVRGVSITKQ
jgi:hypothetical protein